MSQPRLSTHTARMFADAHIKKIFRKFMLKDSTICRVAIT
jgi:hypothetical protein